MRRWTQAAGGDPLGHEFEGPHGGRDPLLHGLSGFRRCTEAAGPAIPASEASRKPQFTCDPILPDFRRRCATIWRAAPCHHRPRWARSHATAGWPRAGSFVRSLPTPILPAQRPSHARLSPDERHDRRRPQGGPRAWRATSARSSSCRSRSRVRPISSPPPTTAPRRRLFRELSKARPGYGFLMEERGVVEGPDKTHRWIVDPLDGTTNFLHGIPLFCHRHRAGARGRDRRAAWSTIRSTMNCTPPRRARAPSSTAGGCRVAARKTLADCVIATGIPHRGRPAATRASLRECKALMEPGRRHPPHRLGGHRSRLGGRGPFRRLLGAQSEPWDMAAGIVLVREAGGLRHRRRRRPRHVRDWQHRRRQRPDPQGAARGAWQSAGEARQLRACPEAQVYASDAGKVARL